jgi:ATP-binding cassette subfamily F protein 3
VGKSFSNNGHGPNHVLRRLNGLIRNGDRVGLVGHNGSGKSVLFKLISGQMTPTSGEVWVGPSIRLGLYTQEHQSLDMASTAVDTVRRVKPMYEEQAYGFLGRFLFNYDKARRPISTLSGGEKARLQLACLMLEGANCLLLDEPTNNLDIESAEVLERALADYPGTVIVISHDRYFLDRVVDSIWELKEGNLREFDGAWSEYVEQARRG